SWPGEAVAVPDGPAALEVLSNQLKPGDVVLVKASRAAHLEGVAAGLLAAGGATAGGARAGDDGEANR
ncbi:MAG: UDP-N-acetylmuramoyl-tripeptide--D-alanyl-D-alanine ligase, partial [Streptosporangiaceae bacterium]